MKKFLIVDLHCDTISELLDNNDNINNKKYSVNIKNGIKYKPYIQCMAIFIAPRFLNEKNGGFKRSKKIIEKVEEQCKEFSNDIIHIKTKKELHKVILNKKVGIILTVENGSAISGNLEKIKYFKEKGVKIMSIVWNEDNDLASGALTKKDNGLTELGKKYVQELEKQNIIIDLSHASKKTFNDTLKITQKPLIVSHACCKAICNHPRNLTDEQIIEIGKRNGIIGVCLYSAFLKASGKATITDVVKHIKHIKELIGIEGVAIGSDFEGIDKKDLPKGIKAANDIYKILLKLQEIGYSEDEIEKIAGKNVIEFLKKY